MLKLKIRNVKLSELPRAVYVTRQAYKYPYKAHGLVTKPHEAVDIIEQFKKRRFHILIALYQDKIIGAIRYMIFDKKLYFYNLATLKSYRNQGVGPSLVKKVESIAKRKKLKKILLDCAEEKQLTEYYKLLGYKIDMIKKHHDHHDVYMSKTI